MSEVRPIRSGLLRPGSTRTMGVLGAVVLGVMAVASLGTLPYTLGRGPAPPGDSVGIAPRRVAPVADFPAAEAAVRKFWADNDIVARSRSGRVGRASSSTRDHRPRTGCLTTVVR